MGKTKKIKPRRSVITVVARASKKIGPNNSEQKTLRKDFSAG